MWCRPIGNADPTRADMGFGLGVAVQTTPGIVRTAGSVGSFSWPGAYGTNWLPIPKSNWWWCSWRPRQGRFAGITGMW